MRFVWDAYASFNAGYIAHTSRVYVFVTSPSRSLCRSTPPPSKMVVTFFRAPGARPRNIVSTKVLFIVRQEVHNWKTSRVLTGLQNSLRIIRTKGDWCCGRGCTSLFSADLKPSDRVPLPLAREYATNHCVGEVCDKRSHGGAYRET